MEEEQKLVRGAKVVVRAFGDRPLVRRVWEITDRKVYICNEKVYQELARGEYTPFSPVGFPWNDVFCYDEEVAKLVPAEAEDDYSQSSWKDSTFWLALKHWRGVESVEQEQQQEQSKSEPER